MTSVTRWPCGHCTQSLKVGGAKPFGPTIASRASKESQAAVAELKRVLKPGGRDWKRSESEVLQDIP